jgi:quercetin dioxygenase-like cupin family protein
LTRAASAEGILRKRVTSLLAAAMVAAVLGGGPLAAQQGGQAVSIRRIILQSHDIPGTNLEFVEALTEVAPNAVVPRHIHPGPEIMFILQGSLTLEVEGAPTRTLTAGQSAYNPTGIPHGGRAGPEGVKFLVTWVLPQGKPLAAPAKSGRRAQRSPPLRANDADSGVGADPVIAR